MKGRHYFLMVLVAGILFITGCWNSKYPGRWAVEAGSFYAKVDGFEPHTFRGKARFNTLHGLDNTPIFYLSLSRVPIPGKKYNLLNFVRAGHSTPEENRYLLGNSEGQNGTNNNLFTATYEHSDSPNMYRAVEGWINIEWATEEKLAGSFKFPAFKLISNGKGGYTRKEIEVTGKFFAKKGNVGIILN